MKYQVIATLPTNNQGRLVENADSLSQAESIAQRFKDSLADDWQIDIIPVTAPCALADVMKVNAAKQEKLRRERVKDNRHVLKKSGVKR